MGFVMIRSSKLAECSDIKDWLCEIISVKSPTVIKYDYLEQQTSCSVFSTVYNVCCKLSRYCVNQPFGMERSEMQNG